MASEVALLPMRAYDAPLARIAGIRQAHAPHGHPARGVPVMLVFDDFCDNVCPYAYVCDGYDCIYLGQAYGDDYGDDDGEPDDDPW